MITAFFDGRVSPGRPKARRVLDGMLTMLTPTTLTENSVSTAFLTSILLADFRRQPRSRTGCSGPEAADFSVTRVANDVVVLAGIGHDQTSCLAKRFWIAS